MKETNECVFVLQHSYEYGEDLEYTETKMLGVFSSKKSAEKAIEFYKTLVGFSDYPNDFYIGCYKLDERHWREGFVNWDDE